jgi:hypothetical protein
MDRFASLICQLLVVLACAVTGGLAAAHATVDGAHLSAPSPNARYAGQQADDACSGCSEREAGYRWAMVQNVLSPQACINESWEFRLGCLLFLTRRD